MYCSENYDGDYNVTLGMQARALMSLVLTCAPPSSRTAVWLCCALQRSFEDLLYQNKVDLALWGHYHSYERCVLILPACARLRFTPGSFRFDVSALAPSRTCPVYKNKCDPSGTVHVVAGMAGAGERSCRALGGGCLLRGDLRAQIWTTRRTRTCRGLCFTISSTVTRWCVSFAGSC